MYGAIIGDLAGSIYEYEQTKGIKNIKADSLIPENAFYSDDTILTIAITDAILHDKDYEKYLKKYIEKYKDYKPDFSPYFKSSLLFAFNTCGLANAILVPIKSTIDPSSIEYVTLANSHIFLILSFSS